MNIEYPILKDENPRNQRNPRLKLVVRDEVLSRNQIFRLRSAVLKMTK